jgi:hypothetical protein
MEARPVSTETWAFEVGRLQWLPIPARAQRVEALSERWVDEAVERARVVTVSGEEVESEWRPLFAEMLDRAPDGEGAVFFPFGLFAPLHVAFDTRTAEATNEILSDWLSEEHAAVDSRALDADALEGARLVMRIERPQDGPVSYAVGLFGVDRELGIAITARTEDPIVAGQFADAGIPLLESFRRAA